MSFGRVLDIGLPFVFLVFVLFIHFFGVPGWNCTGVGGLFRLWTTL